MGVYLLIMIFRTKKNQLTQNLDDYIGHVEKVSNIKGQGDMLNCCLYFYEVFL